MKFILKVEACNKKEKWDKIIWKKADSIPLCVKYIKVAEKILEKKEYNSFFIEVSIEYEDVEFVTSVDANILTKLSKVLNNIKIFTRVGQFNQLFTIVLQYKTSSFNAEELLNILRDTNKLLKKCYEHYKKNNLSYLYFENDSTISNLGKL